MSFRRLSLSDLQPLDSLDRAELLLNERQDHLREYLRVLHSQTLRLRWQLPYRRIPFLSPKACVNA